MSPQSRAQLIEEILANLRSGQVAVIALFDESANVQYFINAVGQVAFTGVGPGLVEDAAVEAVAPGVGLTRLDHLTSAELIQVIDTLGEDEASAIVALEALTDKAGLPSYFESYFTGDVHTLEAISQALKRG